jgi:hypothetical protein
MGLGEVCLQVLVLFVADVLVLVSTKVAGEMVSVQVLEELQVTEEELLAEIAVRMRQDVTKLVVSYVTVLNVPSQGLDVVKALFSDEDRSTSQAHLAECLVVLGLQVALQALDVWELLVATAVVHHAGKFSELHACPLGLAIVKVYGLVFLVLVTLALQLLFEVCPLKVPVIGDDHLFQLSLADGALLVLHDESQPEAASVADVLVATNTQGKVGQLVQAENATFVMRLVFRALHSMMFLVF